MEVIEAVDQIHLIADGVLPIAPLPKGLLGFNFGEMHDRRPDRAALTFANARGGIQTGQPAYPADLLKLYWYRDLLRVRASHRLEAKRRRIMHQQRFRAVVALCQ